MKIREQLTEQQIKEMESWVEKKKTNSMLTKSEKKMIDTIEDFKKNNWQGYRLSGTRPITKESAQKDLDELSRKNI
ncbi:ribosomal protein S13 [Sedimentibacter acidaminivorans]|uniref:Ribosomal protein S13 n=1 Tax=Sedimentibacter acidaminivorans TaxID=913099 RepID=A0ABS4GDX9_9FIRM|nr:hypothetical protein [Sedimentibacter acidaminivorans]MBP1925847.1 ribosomal protein S13 [Sedimentibacter acidaminivorans]